MAKRSKFRIIPEEHLSVISESYWKARVERENLERSMMLVRRKSNTKKSLKIAKAKDKAGHTLNEYERTLIMEERYKKEYGKALAINALRRSKMRLGPKPSTVFTELPKEHAEGAKRYMEVSPSFKKDILGEAEYGLAMKKGIEVIPVEDLQAWKEFNILLENLDSELRKVYSASGGSQIAKEKEDVLLKELADSAVERDLKSAKNIQAKIDSDIESGRLPKYYQITLGKEHVEKGTIERELKKRYGDLIRVVVDKTGRAERMGTFLSPIFLAKEKAAEVIAKKGAERQYRKKLKIEKKMLGKPKISELGLKEKIELARQVELRKGGRNAEKRARKAIEVLDSAYEKEFQEMISRELKRKQERVLEKNRLTRMKRLAQKRKGGKKR